MNLPAKKALLMGLPVMMCLTFSIAAPAFAQVAGADQGIFSDEEQMLRIKNSQVGQYEQQKSAAERDLQTEDAQNGQYRLYAEKRVQELSKPTAHGGKAAATDAQQLAFFQNWLKRDSAYRAKQMAYINQLQSTISSLQSGTQQTINNLGNDINGMREAVQDKKDAQKFSQMMQMNYFNELQSEMGAASWGRPPEDGTFNSTGGYGLMGGYGMGFGGRRNYGGGW
jgi:hypothetical protein